MAFTGEPSEELIKQIGGHIAFARPLALRREDLPQDVVAHVWGRVAATSERGSGSPRTTPASMSKLRYQTSSCTWTGERHRRPPSTAWLPRHS